MARFVELWNMAADAWWVWVAPAFWQSAIVGLALLIMVAFARRWSSPVRYGLLMVALLKFAVPPLWSAPTGLLSHVGPVQQSVDRSSTDIPSTEETGVLSQTPIQLKDGSGQSSDRNLIRHVGRDDQLRDFAGEHSSGVAGQPQLSTNLTPTVSEPVAPAISPKASGVQNKDAVSAIALSWKAWLMLIHCAGTIVVLLLAFVQIRWLIRVVRSSRVAGGSIQTVVERLEQQLRTKRRARVLLSGDADSPMAFGVFRPTIVLPDEAVDYSEDDLQTVLGHELAHLKQGDGWINWLQLGLMMVWWFHPVFWLVQRNARRLSEHCCDDLLIAAKLTTQDAYCETLLRIADRGSVPVMPIACGMAVRMHPLGNRLKRIMDSGVRRSVRLSILQVISIVAVAVLLLPGLHSQLVQSQESASIPPVRGVSSDVAVIAARDDGVGPNNSVGPDKPITPKAQHDPQDEPQLGSQAEVKHNAPSHVPLLGEQYPSLAHLPRSGNGLRVQLDGRRWVELIYVSGTAIHDGQDQKIFWRANGELIDSPSEFDSLSFVGRPDSNGYQNAEREFQVQVVGPTGTKASMSVTGDSASGSILGRIDSEFVQLQIDSNTDRIGTLDAFVEVKVSGERWEPVDLSETGDVQVLYFQNKSKAASDTTGQLEVDVSGASGGVMQQLVKRSSALYVVVKDPSDSGWDLKFQFPDEEPRNGSPNVTNGRANRSDLILQEDLRKAVRQDLRSGQVMAFYFAGDRPRPKVLELRRRQYDVVRFDNVSVYPGPKSAVRVSLNGVAVTESEPSGKTSNIGQNSASPLNAGNKPVLDASAKDKAAASDSILLTGKVVDHNGKPVPDCWVGMFTKQQVFDATRTRSTLFDQGATLSQEAKTDADGRFSMVAEKEHFVFEGSFWASRRDGSSGGFRRSCTWAYLQKNLTIKIGEAKGGVRIVDDNDMPVANADVVLEAVKPRGSATMRLPQEVRDRQKRTTDADGMVTFVGWESAVILGVSITSKGYGTQVLDPLLASQWRKGNGPSTLKLRPTGRLSGRVIGFDPDQHGGLQLEVKTEKFEGRAPLMGRANIPIDDDGQFHVNALAAGRLSFSSSLLPDSSIKIRFPRVNLLKPAEARVLKDNPQLEQAAVVRQRMIKSDTEEGIPNLDLRILWGDAVSGDGSWRDSLVTKTDADGWWTAKVLPGKINIRNSGGVTGYAGTSSFDGRSGYLGVEAVVAATDQVVILSPERFARSKTLDGKLQYSDGSPAEDWIARGHPVSWNDGGVGAVNTNKDGEFTWTFPDGYPPRLYQVSNREWMNEHHFEDRYVIPKVISKDPLVLQIPDSPPAKQE